MFDSYWKKCFLQEMKNGEYARNELEKFKAEIFEKEVIKNKDKEILQLRSNLAVEIAKNETLRDCNHTLSKALGK